MRYSENLHLNLPEDSDPLEVSKLSENFEKLDKEVGDISGGGDTSVIVSGMKVGDITYSIRNLEEETGGVLIACDQRTIDVRAYPGIPKNVLYWPYPVDLGVYATNSITPDLAREIDVHGADSISTDMVKYIPATYYTGSTTYYKIAIYNEGAGEFKWFSAERNRWFVRISDDRVFAPYLPGSGANVRLYHNDLTTYDTIASVNNAANYLKYDLSAGAGVYRLANGRILSLAQGNAAYYGVRYTDDMFTSLQSASVPSNMPTDLARLSSMTNNASSAANRNVANHFHPVVIDGEKIYVICYPESKVAGTDIPTSSITDARIEGLCPTIYYSDNNGASFQKRPLPDGLIETLRTFFNMDVGKPDSGSYYTRSWLSDLCLRLGNHVYIRYTNGYRIASSSGTDTYIYKYIMYIAVNLKTNQIDYVSDAIDADGSVNGSATHRVFVNSNMQTFVYTKKDHMLYCYTNSDIYRLDLQTFEAEKLNGMLYPGAINAGKVLQIGPTHYAMYLTYAKDERLNQRGTGIPAAYGCRIIDTENFIPGKSEIEASTVFPVGNVSGSSGYINNAASTVTTAMTEYNGDIYIAYGNTMYKMPREKRQMPYIPNGYMKVLDEEVSG